MNIISNNFHNSICNESSNSSVIGTTTTLLPHYLIPYVVLINPQTIVRCKNLRYKINSAGHLDSGLYEVVYTPIVGRLYDINIYLEDKAIWSDLSTGVHVHLSSVDSLMTSHNAPRTITVGIQENFTMQSVGIFGNSLTSSLAEGYEFYVALIEKVLNLSSMNLKLVLSNY